MASNRKWSDEQRGVIFDLHKQGFKPTEIARRCREGTTSCKPFPIPRRTVAEIVQKMAFERAWKPPKRLEDLEDAEVLREFPRQFLGIVKAESDRIIRKAQQKKLPDADVTRATKLVKLASEIHSLYSKPGFTGTRSQPAGNGSKASVTTLERLTDTMGADPE